MYAGGGRRSARPAIRFSTERGLPGRYPAMHSVTCPMDYFVYLTYRFVVLLLAILPLPVVFVAGKILGAICYFVIWPYRRLVLANLGIAFQEGKSPREIRALGLSHFSTLGANLLSSISIASMTREKILRIVTIENFEAAKQVAAGGRGVVLVISHIGNWELFAQIMPLIVAPG